MENQTELLLDIHPDEHLGSKIYKPKSPETISEINIATSLFNEKLGPNSAKFAQLLIMEEKPAYPEYSQDEIDGSMGAFARGFSETANADPFNLISYADTKMASLNRKINKTKIEGAATGISEVNNVKLKELGEAVVLTGKVIEEISKKYPKEFLKLRGK